MVLNEPARPRNIQKGENNGAYQMALMFSQRIDQVPGSEHIATSAAVSQVGIQLPEEPT